MNHSNKLLLGVLLALVLGLFPRCFFSSCKDVCSLQQPLEEKASCACKECLQCPTNKSKQQQQQQKYTFDIQSININPYKLWTAEQWEAEAVRLMDLNEENGFTIVATANSGHVDFTLNWAASLKRNQFHKFLVFCFDIDLFKVLLEHGLATNAVLAPTAWMVTEKNKLGVISNVEEKWMSTGYNALTQAKLSIQRELLQRNYSFLFSDVDLVFLSPHTVRHVKLLFGERCTKHNLDSCFTDFAYMYDQDTDVNTGFFAVVPTDTMKLVFDRTIAAMGKWGVDQLGFNYEIRTMMKIKYSKHFKGLDKLLYSNGWTMDRAHLNKKLDIEPLVFHANYVEGKEAKTRMMLAHNFWYL